MPGYKPFFKSVATELNSLFEELGISNLDQYNIETIENKNHLNTKANYTDFSACHFSIAFKASDKSEHLPRRTQVELVIDRGSNPQWNDKVFEALIRGSQE